MRISVANIGRRPLMMLHLVMQAGNAQWSRTLKQPTKEPRVLDVSQWIEEVQRSYVAQETAVKLAEGEVYEIVLPLEDFQDEFVFVNEDAAKIAEALFMADAACTLYEVKGARKHIQELHGAWNERHG